LASALADCPGIETLEIVGGTVLLADIAGRIAPSAVRQSVRHDTRYRSDNRGDSADVVSESDARTRSAAARSDCAGGERCWQKRGSSLSAETGSLGRSERSRRRSEQRGERVHVKRDSWLAPGSAIGESSPTLFPARRRRSPAAPPHRALRIDLAERRRWRSRETAGGTARRTAGSRRVQTGRPLHAAHGSFSSRSRAGSTFLEALATRARNAPYFATGRPVEPEVSKSVEQGRIEEVLPGKPKTGAFGTPS